jgi:hypothetical protein
MTVVDKPNSLLTTEIITKVKSFMIQNESILNHGRSSLLFKVVNVKNFSYITYRVQIYNIFFITYESAQYARLLNNTKLGSLASDKHSNLVGMFVSYKENEAL